MENRENTIKIKDGSTVLFIGDSITDLKFNRRMNITIHGKDVYALQVARELKKNHKGLKFYYKGIASNRTYHLYDRLTKDCIDLKPDVIIMLIGVNDAWENYVPENYPPLRRPMRPHVEEIYRRIKTELDQPQLLILLPFLIDTIKEKAPFHEVLNRYRSELAELAEANNAVIIDLQKAFDEEQKTVPSKTLAVDGIHPTNAGHSVIAKEILRCLK